MANKANKSILIGVPCITSIKVPTVSSIFAAANSLEVPAKLHIYESSLVHDARNKIAQRALDEGATHLMFIDSDISFPANAIQQLLDHDLDVVGGLYFRKRPPHMPTFSQVIGKKITFPTTFPRKDLFEVFGIGTGFLMINTKVLKKIQPPWFFFGNYHGQAIGEDIYFCRKAKAKKFGVWCDPTIPIQHIGEYDYDIKDYEAYQKSSPEMDVEQLWDL